MKMKKFELEIEFEQIQKNIIMVHVDGHYHVKIFSISSLTRNDPF